MKTIVVQIGNSDNKLTQSEWSQFWALTDAVLRECSNQMHFAGTSDPTSPWQNAAWIFEPRSNNSSELAAALSAVAKTFRQDSIAVTIGDTIFVTAGKGVAK